MKEKNKNHILIIVTFVITLLLFELVLRVWFPIYHAGYINVYKYDEELGSILKPNLHHYNTTDYQQEVRTNHLNTVNFQESFKDYEKLIFTLGDSFTQGTGLPSDASYPFQLDLILNLNNNIYEKKFAVVNLGLAAFGAEQAILAFERYKNKIGRPNYVLYLGCSNDYLDDTKFIQGYKHKNFVDGSPMWGAFVKPLQWLRNDLEIGKRVFFLVDQFRIKRITNNNEGRKNKVTSKSVAELQSDKYEKLFEISKKQNSTLIVSWANIPGDDGSYEYMKEWANKNDVLFADWYSKVDSVKKSIPSIPLYNSHSGGHHRIWVNYMIAKSFSEHIIY